ncbi:MAG TPA: hypothetical protein PK036_11475 [Geobacteraceae bacterium]|nr:hypothetical protein [Geobacteraceae bacterium]
MSLSETVTIGDSKITVRELTVREIYGADMSPPESQDLIPLYLALDVDYALVLAAVDAVPGELVDLHPSDLDRITEAFRKANPFLEKPLVAQSRARQREILVNSYSELFAASLRLATDPEPGNTP